MSLSFTKGLNEKVKFHNLENSSYLAMADLMLMGWSEKDAYIVAFSPEMSSNDIFISNRVKAILKMPDFKKYMDIRSMSMSTYTKEDKKTKGKAKNDNGEFKPMSKEDVLKDLQNMLALTPPSDRKGRSDLLKSIADLMRFKDDIVEGSTDTRTYYLPKKCYHCEWYEGREKDRIL